MEFAPNKNLIYRAIAGEAILVPIRGDLAEMERIFSFNQAGRFIWEQLEQRAGLESIVQNLCQEFDVDKETAKKDAHEFIQELARAGLVEELEE